MAEQETELLDYEEEEDAVEAGAGDVAADGEAAPAKKDVKGTYVSVHSSGFRDFLLKPEILKAIVDCGFEHPSEGKFFFRIALSRLFIWLLATANFDSNSFYQWYQFLYIYLL